MKFTVITLFPRMIEAVFSEGLIAQARKSGAFELATLNPRDFTQDVHRTVDDRAFGGGDGMVMKAEPLARAVESLGDDAMIAVLSPQGRPWSQAMACDMAAQGGHVALVCGRYAGLDQRFVEVYADMEISLGDFILNGGEIAACAVLESVVRLRPGVLGNRVSSHEDSFSATHAGGLECPQFTRPRDVLGLPVPAPLLTGDHAKIREFEKWVSLVRTRLLRPDLGAKGEGPGAALRAARQLRELSPEELVALGLNHEILQQLENDHG